MIVGLKLRAKGYRWGDVPAKNFYPNLSLRKEREVAGRRLRCITTNAVGHASLGREILWLTIA